MTDGEGTPEGMFRFEELIGRAQLVGPEDDVALDWIAQLVDLAGDRMSNDGLRKALAWSGELRDANPSS